MTPKKRIVCFDFETTGLSPEKNQPIEIAAKAINPDGSIDVFHSLVRPPDKLHEKIVEITGITDEMLQQEGRSECEVLPEFLQFLRLEEDAYLIGHNMIRFDVNFLIWGCKRINHGPLPVFSGWDTAGQYKAVKMGLKANPGETTLRYHLRALNQLVKGLTYKLAQCCEEAQIQVIGAHRAMSDVEMTLRLYLHQIDAINQTTYLKNYVEQQNINTERIIS